VVTQVAAAARIPSLRGAETHDDLTPDARGWPVRQQWRDPRGVLLASGGTTDAGCWMHWPEVGLFLFGPSRDEVVVHPARGARASDIDDTYLRGVLPVSFLAQGYEALHASAVLVRDRVVAFAAESGIGKSTLAAAVARVGGTQWADDTTICSLDGAAPLTVALPFPQRLDAPARAALTAVPGEPRAVLPGMQAPLAALYVVKRTDLRVGYAEFRRVPEAVAFRRLLAHAHPFDLMDGRPRQLLERMLLLASRVPVVELTVRSGLHHLPAVASLVSRHAASIHAA
jgi:hypothetical protein